MPVEVQLHHRGHVLTAQAPRPCPGARSARTPHPCLPAGWEAPSRRGHCSTATLVQVAGCWGSERRAPWRCCCFGLSCSEGVGGSVHGPGGGCQTPRGSVGQAWWWVGATSPTAHLWRATTALNVTNAARGPGGSGRHLHPPFPGGEGSSRRQAVVGSLQASTF